ncbi:hypothetical protein L917_12997, partial [Phytophthora nicotianae]
MTRRQKKAQKRVRFADVTPADNQDKASEQRQTPEPTTDTTTHQQREIPNANDIDPIAVQEERRHRIAKAQNEEVRWSNLKAVLRGETDKLAYKVVRNVMKVADKFVLTADDVLYYVGARRRRDNERDQDVQLRLVVPTTMIQE